MRRAFLALPALAIVLAGCGDDGESAEDLDPVELIRSTPDALAEVGTAHMAMNVDAGPASISAEGEFDFEAQQGTMTMELPAPLSTSFDMVFDGTTYFMSAEAFPVLPDLDAEWISFDAEELAEQSGVDVDQLSQGGATNNPAEMLAALEGVSEDGIEEVGSEEIRGVETTHYAGEIDMQAAVEQADVTLDDATVQQFEELYGEGGVPFDVWIDGDGLTRRMDLTTPVEGQDVTVSIEMFDYGEPVDIDVPSGDEAVDFLDLMGELGGG